MSLVLQVRNGPHAGRSIEPRAGQAIRVGRSGWADWVLPDDAKISDIHFLVEVAGDSIIVRDVSATGTFLNGRKIASATLAPGDRLVAGGTEFEVCAATEPVPAAVATPVPADSGVAVARGERVLERLRGQGRPLFAILDAARDTRALVLLMQSQEKYQSLYEGPDGDQLAIAAPYLVSLPPASPVLEILAREAWGRSWGIYLTSGQPFEAVRKHFRRFLLVTTEEGKELYFRYYDPRVLRIYLPSCTPDEARQFFGPIESYLLEDANPDTMLVFDANGPIAKPRTLSLASASGPAALEGARP